MATSTAYTTTGAWDAARVTLTAVVKALITAFQTQRVVTDGVLNATTTVTSATAAFTASDVGRGVTGTGVPVGTFIASVTNGTTAVLTQAATASASSVSLTIVAGTDLNVAERTGGYLNADKVANLRLRTLWSYGECFAVANAFGQAIGFTVS